MAANALVCPACGARNKPKWEFCVRCGESMQGVAPVRAAKAPAKAEAGDSRPSTGSSWILLAFGLVLVGAILVAGVRYAQKAPPLARPDPGMFAMPTEPKVAPSAPGADEPGAKDFAEGQRLYGEGKAAAALPYLERASAASSNPRVRQFYAKALWATGAREPALARFAEAAHLDPEHYALEYAAALEKAEKFPAAVAEYERILGRDANNTAIKEALGNVLTRAGDFRRAVPFLEAVAGQRPDDLALKQNLAYAYEKLGDSKRAAEVYRGVLDRVPDAHIARTRLVDMLYGEGKQEDALALLRAGIQRDPGVPGFHRQLGYLLEKSGRRDDAIREYKEYVRLAPNAPDAKELSERLAKASGGSS